MGRDRVAAGGLRRELGTEDSLQGGVGLRWSERWIRGCTDSVNKRMTQSRVVHAFVHRPPSIPGPGGPGRSMPTAVFGLPWTFRKILGFFAFLPSPSSVQAVAFCSLFLGPPYPAKKCTFISRKGGWRVRRPKGFGPDSPAAGGTCARDPFHVPHKKERACNNKGCRERAARKRKGRPLFPFSFPGLVLPCSLRAPSLSRVPVPFYLSN